MPDAVFDDARLAANLRRSTRIGLISRSTSRWSRSSAHRSVIDLGCGTGAFALMLAEPGVKVIGVNPAGASLDVARAKPGADRMT